MNQEQIKTPNFQNTHVYKRLVWAKENLKKYYSDYRIVYEDNVDECAKIMTPDPNWMACALQGGILPPLEAYFKLKEDEKKLNFERHSRGYLLHNSKPVEAMTEEQAVEYLIKKDCPKSVWKNYNKSNKLKMIICKKNQLPSNRKWRNTWKIKEELVSEDN
jgi:hypothetical protein|tara:strand:- start:238 stop:720 length:483 start_codon:yes stop_codon:yes gene_type:complete